MSTTPVTSKYKHDRDEALEVLSRLQEEHARLEIQIAKQKRIVAALHELTETTEDGPPITGLVEGVTDACRVVFRSFDKPLLPVEVSKHVQALGLPPQSNLLASVHTTIRRMKEAGEIKEVFESQAGGSAVAAYIWTGETNAAKLRRRVAEREAAEEMRKAGSEIGTPTSIESETKAGVGRKFRFRFTENDGK